jgi:ribosomal protein S21
MKIRQHYVKPSVKKRAKALRAQKRAAKTAKRRAAYDLRQELAGR